MNRGRLNHCLTPVILIVLFVVVVLSSACAASTPAASKMAPTAQNTGLVVRYLTAPKQVMPSRGAEILCVATDTGTGALSYEWSATGGEIQKRPEPESILWVAPSKEGSYTVTVVVTNAAGAKATRSVNIAVTKEPDPRPVIYSVKCLECRDGVEASRLSQYTLRCEASSPGGGGLHYTWFASRGKIVGDGPNVMWFTSSQYGNTLITVVVADDKGNETEGYLAINISCCN